MRQASDHTQRLALVLDLRFRQLTTQGALVLVREIHLNGISEDWRFRYVGICAELVMLRLHLAQMCLRLALACWSLREPFLATTERTSVGDMMSVRGADLHRAALRSSSSTIM